MTRTLQIRIRSFLLFAVFVLLILSCGPAWGAPQQAAKPQWDADGGFSADYSRIEHLKWTGPGRIDTYEEYLTRRDGRPFEAMEVTELSNTAAAPSATNGKALVLVNSTLYPSIQTRLDAYVTELASDDYDVELHTITGGTEEDLKAFILSHSTDLVGCVFVGDLPIAWYEMDYDGYENFPCDLYYMDLDGEWSDTDNNGRWDTHVGGAGDQGPEIFIGHIDASMMGGADEATQTNAYLDKVQAYKDRLLPKRDYALTYTEDDWATSGDIKNSIKYTWPDYEAIVAPDTTKADYRDFRLPNTSYDMIQLACHSSASAHYFTRGGQFASNGVKNTEPQAFFYNLFCCSGVRYSANNYLGGAYIYNNSDSSLAVIGSTKTGSMLTFSEFYKPFGEFKTFGESFRIWFNYLAPYNNEERYWHYGMTIAGDPFLAVLQPVLNWGFPNDLPSGMILPGVEMPITISITNADEDFTPGSGQLHYRFDPVDPYSTVPLTPIGGNLFVGVLPATSPGDQPEFYFSAVGDEGTTTYSPENAPAEHYSFYVGVQELLFEDDFEGDKGWLVANTDLADGAWERAVPEMTSYQPGEDHSENGTQCFVTGKDGIFPTGDDVDGGPTRLISPMFDLEGVDGNVEFYLYFYHSSSGIQQPLTIEITNTGSAPYVMVAALESQPEWTHMEFRVSDYVTPSDTMRVRFSVEDNPDDDIVEALLDDFVITTIDYTPSLWADQYSISVATGGEIDFALDAGMENAGRPYLVLGTLSGTTPGFALPGGEVLPINWDVFTDLLLAFLFTPVCPDFYSTLDGSGEGSATLALNMPIDPSLIGASAHFAYLLKGWQGFDYTSNPLPITFEP